MLGFLDDSPSKRVEAIEEIPVLGEIGSIGNLFMSETDIYICCAIGSPESRKKIAEKIIQLRGNVKFPTLVHPTAVIADNVHIQEGCIIGAFSFISCNVKVGKFLLINYGSMIGHDCNLGDFSCVYAGSKLAGNVEVGEGVQIGIGANIIPNKSVGTGAIIGAGSTVIDNIPSSCTAVGIPARVIKMKEGKQGEE